MENTETELKNLLAGLNRELSDLDREYEAKKRRVTEKKQAVQAVLSMLPRSVERHVTKSAVVNHVQNQSGGSFTDILRKVIETDFADRDFIVGDLHDYLEERDRLPKGKKPKARIAQTLTYLENKGIVEREKVEGQMAHLFRLKKLKLVSSS